ncbi:MAG: hypothetical protein ABI883_05000 [Chthoniobacterales bacterium]
MKTFDEKMAAWLEGRLEGNELAQFEAALPEISAAEVEQQQADVRLGALLKAHLTAPAMANQEFFHHQLRTEIEGETRGSTTEHSEFAQPRRSWWSIGRIVWTGAAALAALVVCTFVYLREDNTVSQSAYLTQIINARITDPDASPDATITMFESKEEKATVVWIDGLRSLPSEYAAK